MKLGQVGIEAEADFAQLAALVVGEEHLLAAGQGESVGVQADGDAVAGDVSQRSDDSLEGGKEGSFVWGEAIFCGRFWFDIDKSCYEENRRVVCS